MSFTARTLRRVGSWIRSAPGTYTWLTILAMTTFVLVHLPDDIRGEFLAERSTNVEHLLNDPLHVLLASAFWTSTPSWLLYAVLFTIVHAPVERWLGTRRWLAVAALGHVAATFISEALVGIGVELEWLDHAALNTIDVGVSYGLAAVAGVLTFRIATPWRWGYLAASFVFFLVPAVATHTFTSFGHLSALLVGLACVRLVDNRPVWNPATVFVRSQTAPRSSRKVRR